MDKMLSFSDAAAGSGSPCFTSTSFGCGGLLIDPKLLRFPQDQAAQQSLIATERRAARDGRALMRREPTL